MKRPTRQKHRVLKKEKEDVSDGSQPDPPKKTKGKTANKLLKFYALLELNKKEFLEDYVFESYQQ